MQKAMFIINAFENKTPVHMGCMTGAEFKAILVAIRNFKHHNSKGVSNG